MLVMICIQGLTAWWQWWWYGWLGWTLSPGPKQQRDGERRHNGGGRGGEADQGADEEREGERQEEGQGRGQRVAGRFGALPCCVSWNKVGTSLICYSAHYFWPQSIFQGGEFCARHILRWSCPCGHKILLVRSQEQDFLIDIHAQMLPWSNDFLWESSCRRARKLRLWQIAQRDESRRLSGKTWILKNGICWDLGRHRPWTNWIGW